MKALKNKLLIFLIYAPAFRDAMADAERKKKNGEQHNELAIRFFKYKLHTLRHELRHERSTTR